MNDNEDTWQWKPVDYYQPHPDLPFAVIILNESLDLSNIQFVCHLWEKACIRMCVDGGTNFYHYLLRNGPQASGRDTTSSQKCPLPDLITGDFDSIEPDLLKLYQNENVNIVPTPDQDETDFTKAIKELGKFTQEKKLTIDQVLVIAGVHSQRFDHIMAHLATLFKVGNLISVPVIMLCKGSLVWLLKAGSHSIAVERELMIKPDIAWCGLIPLGHPAMVSTLGLKWNLDNQELSFGSLVSTSNTYDLNYEAVKIHTSHPLIWMMGVDTDSGANPSAWDKMHINGDTQVDLEADHSHESIPDVLH